MGFGRTVLHNAKPVSDSARIWKGGFRQFRDLRPDAKKLKVGFLIGSNIAKKLDLPRHYREHFDLKRVNERIGKALFFADSETEVAKGNLIAIKENRIDWADGATEEQRSSTTLGTQIFSVMKEQLPDWIFTRRTSDRKIDSNYYINLLDSDPSIFSARTKVRPLSYWRAHGSLAGFKAQERLKEEVIKDENIELIPSNFKDAGFKGPAILEEKCLKIFFSDTHMGGGGFWGRRANDFAPRKEEFVKLLHYIENIIPKAKEKDIKVVLIMIGDIAEKWQFEWDEIYRGNKQIVRELLNLGIDIYYVVGNHDMDAAEFRNKMIIGKNGTKVCITDMVKDNNGIFVHGHGADPFNKTLKEADVSKKPFGVYITKIAKYLEYIYPNVEEILEAAQKAFRSGKFKEAYVNNFVKYIDNLKLAFFAGMDIVFKPILGHTHKKDRGNGETLIGKDYAKNPSKNTTYYNDGTAGVKKTIAWGVKNRAGNVEIIEWPHLPTINIWI